MSPRPVSLRQVHEQDRKVYGETGYWVRSEACIMLDFGEGRLPGMLAFASDDPNHFHPSYFGKGARWHDPQSDKMEEAYLEAKSFLDSKGVEVLNCTIGGNLEVFPRRSLREALEGANGDALFAASELLDRFLEDVAHVSKD